MSTSAFTAPNEPDAYEPDAYGLGTRAPIKTADERRVQDQIDRLLDEKNAKLKIDKQRAERAAKEKANKEVRWLLRVCWSVGVGLLYFTMCTYLPAYLLTYFCPQAMEDDRQNGRRPVVKAGLALSIFLGAVSGRVFVSEVCSTDGKYFVYLAPIDNFGAACLKRLIGKYLGITAKSTRLCSERRHLPTFRNEEVVVQLPHADLVYVASLATHGWCVWCAWYVRGTVYANGL